MTENMFSFSAFVGGEPKPQQQVREVATWHTRSRGVPGFHQSVQTQCNGNRNCIYNATNGGRRKPHHLRRDHQQFRNRENRKLKKKTKNQEDKKFRLWEEGPNFDTDLRQDVYAQEGQIATLTCRVFERGNKTVRHVKI